MSRTLTLVGYAVLAALLVACQVAAVLTRRIPTAGEAISAAMRRRPGRWLLLGAWLWAGWHLFVRSHGVA